jgi:hypothetical protein
MAAALTNGLLGVSSGAKGSAISAVAAALTYWYTNSVMTGCASAVRFETRLDESVRTQAQSEWPVLILVTAVALMGVATHGHTWKVVIYALVAIVVFDCNLRQKASHSSFAPPLLIHNGSLIVGLGAALLCVNLALCAVALVSFFVFITSPNVVGGLAYKVGLVMAGMAAGVLAVWAHAPAAVQFLIASVLVLVLLVRRILAGASASLTIHTQSLVSLGMLVPSRWEAMLTAGVMGLCMAGLGGMPQFGAAAVATIALFVLARPLLRNQGQQPRSLRTVNGQRTSVGVSR